MNCRVEDVVMHLSILGGADQPLNPREEMEKKEFKSELDRIFTTLRVHERDILELRFWDKYTLKAIGLKYGIGPERIRQICGRALRKLRHPSRMKKLEATCLSISRP